MVWSAGKCTRLDIEYLAFRIPQTQILCYILQAASRKSKMKGLAVEQERIYDPKRTSFEQNIDLLLGVKSYSAMFNLQYGQNYEEQMGNLIE